MPLPTPMNRTASQPPAVKQKLVEEPFRRGEDGEEADRGEHREGAHRQRRISREIRPVEHAADGAAERAREHGKLADPFATRAGGDTGLLPERHRDTRHRQQDAQAPAHAEPLVAERGGDHHGQERERREDQRRARRRDELQPVVQQRDQDAELRDAEEPDGQEVAARESGARRRQEDEGHEAAEADRVAQERERGRAALVHDEARGHDGRADLDAGGGRRGRGQELHRGAPAPIRA